MYVRLTNMEEEKPNWEIITSTNRTKLLFKYASMLCCESERELNVNIIIDTFEIQANRRMYTMVNTVMQKYICFKLICLQYENNGLKSMISLFNIFTLLWKGLV